MTVVYSFSHFPFIDGDKDSLFPRSVASSTNCPTVLHFSSVSAKEARRRREAERRERKERKERFTGLSSLPETAMLAKVMERGRERGRGSEGR